MSDLLTQLRKHDLPPRWNGLAVLWRGWEYQPAGVFICPPPTPKADRCQGCGSSQTERGFPVQSVNKGLVAVASFLTHDDLRAEEENRARLKSLASKRKARASWRLFVWRCPACLLDTVWDIDTDEWFDLDHTDYGDEGSS